MYCLVSCKKIIETSGSIVHCNIYLLRDHAYTDPRNEIIGNLGGYYEPIEDTVHVTLFSASVR